jgi:hypothetical protein
MKIEIAPTMIICATCGALLVGAHHPHYECRSTEMCEMHSKPHLAEGHEREPVPSQNRHLGTITVESSATSTLGTTLWWSPPSSS